MYIEPIEFEHNLPIAYDVYKVGSFHLHCHQNIVEILLLLSGTADVKVSFENFVLNEGDYIVINNGDSHSISSNGSDCQIISLYFNMDSYREFIPFIDYVLFSCESFDLAKYKNQTQYLRKMISTILLNLIRGQDRELEEAQKVARDLIWILVNDYDMRNYYCRTWNTGYLKTEKYYTFMKYIFENYNMKNLQEYISKNEFYSKSYITHLFKEVGDSSFQDVLTYVRLYKSEILLLTSDISINEISDLCGFSDIKYYTKNFKKWFLYTPSEYRKKYQSEIYKNDIHSRVDLNTVIDRMEYFIKDKKDNTQYRASINPLSLKLIGNFEEDIGPNISKNINVKDNETNQNEYHQVFIRVGNKDNELSSNLLKSIISFEEAGFKPVIIFNYKGISVSQCKKYMKDFAEIITKEKLKSLEFIIIYNNLGDKDTVNKLAIEGKKIMGCSSIKPTIII